MSNDIGEWYRNIPVVTKGWFTASVVFPLVGRLGIIQGYHFLLVWEYLIYRFHIWRPFTAAVFYPITPQTGFHYLIMLYFLYSYSNRLETGIFDGRPGDYIFMMMFCWLSAVLLGLALNIMIIWEGIILSAVYVWCQINRDQIVTFWFGIRFKAAYLPWVLLGFNFILTGRIMQEILGIFVGHLYFFLKFKYPQDFGGRRLLETPQFLYNYFPNVRGSGGFGSAPPLRRQNNDDNAQGHRWGGGGGRRLGD